MSILLTCVAHSQALAIPEYSQGLALENCFSPQVNDDDTRYTPHAIIEACIQSKAADTLNVQTVNKLSCNKWISQKISARYRVSISGNRIKISHKVLFVLPKQEEQASYFKENFVRSLEEIKQWYRALSINYELEYEFATSKARKKFVDDVVEISFKNKRSNSEIWYQYYTTDLNIKMTSQTDNFSSQGVLPNLAAHELLHLLGLPDDYVDETHPCHDRYGENGTNGHFSSRKASFYNPQGGGFQRNVMWEHTTLSGKGLSSQTLPPDYLYALASPLCPNLCEQKSQIARQSKLEIAREAAIEFKPSMLRKDASLLLQELKKDDEIYGSRLAELQISLGRIRAIFSAQWSTDGSLIDKWHLILSNRLRVSDSDLTLIFKFANEPTALREAILENQKLAAEVNEILEGLPDENTSPTKEYIQIVEYWKKQVPMKRPVASADSVVKIIDFLSQEK